MGLGISSFKYVDCHGEGPGSCLVGGRLTLSPRLHWLPGFYTVKRTKLCFVQSGVSTAKIFGTRVMRVTGQSEMQTRGRHALPSHTCLSHPLSSYLPSGVLSLPHQSRLPQPPSCHVPSATFLLRLPQPFCYHISPSLFLLGLSPPLASLSCHLLLLSYPVIVSTMSVTFLTATFSSPLPNSAIFLSSSPLVTLPCLLLGHLPVTSFLITPY